MRVDYSPILRIDPIKKLLKSAPPFIKYHIHRDLLEFPQYYDEMEDLREQCLSDDEFRNILEQQKDDGHWEPVKKFTKEHHRFGIQFITQCLYLHKLLTLGANKHLNEVQKGIVTLMKMQQEDGKFPLFYQHQGYTLWILMQYGLQGNPFADRGMRWLLRRQRPDGGWLHTVQVPRDENEEDYPSCIWTTCHALWPMVYHNVYSKNESVTRGIKYLLGNFLKVNHTQFFNTPDAWDYLYIGHDETSCFRGGTLKILEIAVDGGFDTNHPVMNKAAKWLCDQQLENGLFPAIAGKDKKGDLMVTVRTLNVLKKLYPESVIVDS